MPVWSSGRLSASRMVLSCIGAFVVVGWAILSVVVAATPGHELNALSEIGIALLLSGGCLIASGLIGFLFAIPKSATSPPPLGPHTGPGGSIKGGNTNLEQISDWLTKVLIGFVLAFLMRRDIDMSWLTIIGGGSALSNQVLFAAIVLFFGSSGLVGGYILTSLALAGEELSIDLLEGLAVAFNLPVGNERQARRIDPADREALDQLLKLDLASLRNDDQRRAWARAQVATGNLEEADTAYRELVYHHESDPELLLERSLVLSRLGKLDEARALRLRAMPLLELAGKSEASPELILGTMANDLYETPPNGFEQVISVGESLSRNLRSEPRLWVYLACAYGQKHAYEMQEERDTPPAELTAIRDQALFCVRQAIELDSSWRLELRRVWDPSAPKEPVENDLESFFYDTDFRAVMNPETEQASRRIGLAEDISTTILGFVPNPLIRFSGAVDVWFERPDDGQVVSKLKCGDKYHLVAEFWTQWPERVRGTAAAVEVNEGEQRAEVPFDLYPEATDIRFQPERIRVLVRAGDAPVRSRFELSPTRAGTFEIWVEIAQGRRTVQMVQLLLDAV